MCATPAAYVLYRRAVDVDIKNQKKKRKTRRGECVCVRTVLLEMSTPFGVIAQFGLKRKKKKRFPRHRPLYNFFLSGGAVRIGPARSVARFGFP